MAKRNRFRWRPVKGVNGREGVGRLLSHEYDWIKEAVHTLTNDGGTGIPLGTEKQRPGRAFYQILQERTLPPRE